MEKGERERVRSRSEGKGESGRESKGGVVH